MWIFASSYSLWGTLAVLLVVIIIIGLIVRSMIKDKKEGKALHCGGDCKHCGGACSYKD